MDWWCTSLCVKQPDRNGPIESRRQSAGAISGLPVAEPKANVDDEDEDEDDDYVDELPDDFKAKGDMKVARSSVSAEAYGAWNQKKAFTPPVILKTDDQKKRIQAALDQAFMFAALDDNEMRVVVDAFQEHKFRQGDKVIAQGDEVTDSQPGLYVLESGTLKAYKKGPNEAFPGREVYMYSRTGESFGELALLYNAPRAASVIAENDCVMWSIDRATFNHMVKDSAAKKRNLYDNFLGSVEILKPLDSHERGQIADALRVKTFKKGETIIREGEPGSDFYIVEVGRATATKGNAVAMSYKKGDFFGELALISNQPRAATVVADEDCKCLMLDRGSFKRLLGPLDSILKERAATLYQKLG